MKGEYFQTLPVYSKQINYKKSGDAMLARSGNYSKSSFRHFIVHEIRRKEDENL